MPTRNAELSPIARTVKDHDRICESITQFDAILAARDLDGVVTRIGEIRPLLEQGLVRHFAVEEQFIFPAMLLGARDQQLVERILALQKAHGRMEEETRRILALLEAGAAGGRDGELLELLARLLAELKAHAVLESEHVLPMAAEDQQIRRQLCRLIESRHDAEK